MKKMLAVMVMLIAPSALTPVASAADSFPQVNDPDIQPIIKLSQEFVSGQRGIKDMVTKEVNIADPRNRIGTVLTSRDGRFMTIVESIKVTYKIKTAIFTARVAMMEKADVTAGNVTISYEKKDGAWQLTSMALRREVISSR